MSTGTNGVQVSCGFALCMMDFYCLRMSTSLSLQLGHFVVFPSRRVSRGKVHTAALVGAMVSSSLSHPHPTPTFGLEQRGLPTFGLEQRGLPTYPVSPSTFASTRAYRVTTAVSRCSSLGLPGEACGEVRVLGCSCLEVAEDTAGPGWPLRGVQGRRHLAVSNGTALCPS